jgi:hypothetical protein
MVTIMRIRILTLKRARQFLTKKPPTFWAVLAAPSSLAPMDLMLRLSA